MSALRVDPKAGKPSTCQCACNGCAQHHTNSPSMRGISNAPEDAISEMDTEIARLCSALFALRRRRNSVLPVSRLPVEVLTDIFAYCVPRQTMDGPLSRTWFYFSHVSHRWRETSLSCPALWTCPDFSLPKMAQEMLTRSGANPLHIRAIFPYEDPAGDPTTLYSDNIRVLGFALQQALRIQHFYLETSAIAFSTLISQEMNVRAPILRYLSIILDDGDGEHSCPLSIFHGDMPQLQHIHLRGCFFNSSFSLPQNLSSLGLNSLSDDDDSMWPAVLLRLESLLRLAELSLEHTIPVGLPKHSHRPIYFPVLKVLHIYDIYECAEDLLELFVLSPPLHLHLSFGDNAVFIRDDGHVLLSMLATFLAKSDVNEPLQSLSCSMRSGDVDLRLCDAQTTWIQPRLQIQSSGPSDDIGLGLLFSGLCSVPWSRNVKKVSIIADSESFTSTSWEQAFKLLYNCEQITVVGWAVMSFLDALSSDAQKAPLSQPLSLSRLRKASLEHTGGPISRHEWLFALNRAFRERGLRQMPLAELCISGNPSVYLPDAEEIGGVERIVEGPPRAKEDHDDADLFRWWTH